jgi:hypothetical protein
MAVSRRYGRTPNQRKKAGLKSLNWWLNQPHPTGMAKKVMEIVCEGRAFLDWIQAVGRFKGDAEECAAKLERLLKTIRFKLAIGGFSSEPNKIWLDIRPNEESGAWELNRLFAIPSDERAHKSGDRDAWAAIYVLMRIAPEGNFPQRCSAPLPRSAGQCARWFVKVTPEQHSCSTRCRQRKIEATDRYRKEKAEKLRKHRKNLKDRERKGLRLVEEELQRGKKR